MLAVLEEMADYDFERVHKVMEMLDWRWLDTTKPGYCVPDVFDLRKTVISLFFTCFNTYLKNNKDCACGTGGFSCSLWKNEDDKFECEIKFQL